MFKYNFKIAIRNILKNKEYTLINLMGLSIGLMSFLFIYLWISDELSYDRFHQYSDRIYRIAWISEMPQTRTPHPMTYTMVRDLPEVENAVSMTPIFGSGLSQVDRLVKYGEKKYNEKDIFAADTTFFQVFSFKLVEGDPATCLKDVGSIIITEKIAKKYFGDEDPLGKIITINFGQDVPFNITGVMQNIPSNSHFHFDFLISYVTMKAYDTSEFFTWADFGHYNYLLLHRGANPRDLEKKMVSWAIPYLDWPPNYIDRFKKGEIGFRLQPLKNIHLYSHLKWELETNGDISYIYIFSALGIFIILIACINFMNLSTANASRRNKEICIKKVNGASINQIRLQFILESIITACISMILAIILFEILTPAIGNIARKPFSLDYGSIYTLLSLTGLAVLCGLLAGFYPAIFLSRISSASVMKGGTGLTIKKSRLRNTLIVFQFSISIFLIIGTLNVSRQVNFLHREKLGFNSDQVVVIPIQDTLIRKNYESVKAEFLTSSSILHITAVSNIPGRRFNQNPIQWKNADEPESCSEIRADPDFLETLGLQLVAGRNFSKDRPADLWDSFIINETAARLFDWKDPVNEEVTCFDDGWNHSGKVIGVVEDFHFQSLHTSIEPLIIQANPGSFNYFLIRINPVNIPKALSFIERKYGELDPEHDFTYFFLDDDFSKMYAAEGRMEQVTRYFTVLAILISCIGLFGLSAYSAERRTKEISIRKVNGASLLSLISLLTREFSGWIILSFLIAAPLAGYFIYRWLEHFAYKVTGSLLVYIVAGVTALVISWLTVSYQSLKVARKNPVDTLRYE